MRYFIKILNSIKKYFSFINLTKCFTLTNIIVGIIGITVGLVFKFTPLGSVILIFCGINPTEVNLYLVAGFTALVTRLGIKGVVEAIFSEWGISPQHTTRQIRLDNPTRMTMRVGNPSPMTMPLGEGNPSPSDYTVKEFTTLKMQNPESGEGSSQHTQNSQQPQQAYWGDPNQPRVDRNNRGGLRVNDPLNQRWIYNSLSVSANQPLLHNLGKALEQQYNVHRITNLSNYTFTVEQAKFVLDHLKWTKKPLYDKLTQGRPRYDGTWGTRVDWWRQANSAEFRANFLDPNLDNKNAPNKNAPNNSAPNNNAPNNNN